MDFTVHSRKGFPWILQGHCPQKYFESLQSNTSVPFQWPTLLEFYRNTVLASKNDQLVWLPPWTRTWLEASGKPNGYESCCSLAHPMGTICEQEGWREPWRGETRTWAEVYAGLKSRHGVSSLSDAAAWPILSSGLRLRNFWGRHSKAQGSLRCFCLGQRTALVG